MAGHGTLIVATDLSDPSLAALRKAAELAAKLGSRLVLAYVVEDRLPPMVAAHTSDPAALLKRHREHAEKALAEFVAKHLPQAQVETVIREGEAPDQIVKLATERSAEMIVIGMHGHGFLAHAFAGSTAERVLHRARCPVLVVPHSG